MSDLWQLDRQLAVELDISSDFAGIPDPMRGLVRDGVLVPADLLPAEQMALTVARSQVGRGENPGINVTAALLLTVERLAGQGDGIV